MAVLPEIPRVLSLANQKGGVGKTTTAINLGTALAAIGEEVLIIDLDPQGNASTGLGIDRRNRSCSTYDVLIALFGGLAGIVAQTRQDRTSTVIPGVAIATALVPPLCAASILLARGQHQLAFGAFLLTFTNIGGDVFPDATKAMVDMAAALGTAGVTRASRPNPAAAIVTGNTVHLLQVEGRREQVLTSAQQRQMARNMLREKKAQEAFETWAREVRGRAYVEYRDPPK